MSDTPEPVKRGLLGILAGSPNDPPIDMSGVLQGILTQIANAQPRARNRMLKAWKQFAWGSMFSLDAPMRSRAGRPRVTDDDALLIVAVRLERKRGATTDKEAIRRFLRKQYKKGFEPGFTTIERVNRACLEKRAATIQNRLIAVRKRYGVAE